MYQMILASGSPRRKEILEQAGLKFCVIPAKGEEKVTGTTPQKVVEELSAQKAWEIARSEAVSRKKAEMTQIILGADTIVSVDEKILGKPETEEEAANMIRMLQGRSHLVYTGVTLLIRETHEADWKEHTFCCETKVFVASMSEKEIHRYLESKEAMDKAGAYGIQGRFAAWIEKIEGDYYNVMGLPLSALWQQIKEYV